MADLIESVAVVTVRSPLPMTIRFGQWVMTHREFALCRIRTRGRPRGVRLRLHPRRADRRDRPPQHRAARDRAAVRRSGRPALAGGVVATTRSSPNGIGLRALGLVDLATWDLAARARSQSISAYLGGERRPMPVTAIIGYPPSLTAGARWRRRSRRYLEAGWRRFKQPIAGDARRDARAPARGPRGDGPGLLARAWTATGCSRTPRTRSISRARSRTSASAGWRTSSRPGTRAWSPRSAGAARCRSRWATSRAAPTTPSRSSPTTRSTSSAST